MLTEKDTLVQLVDSLIAAAQEERVALGTLVQAVGRASFAPLLLLPAIAVATPLSAIPLFSTAMGVVMFLVAIQMVLRREQVWLPRWLLERRLNSARLCRALLRTRPTLAWFDRHTRERLSMLVRRPLVIIPQMICVLSGLMMPVMEFVPMSSTMVGFSMMFMAFGMLARDGLFVLLGMLPYLAIGTLITKLVAA